MVNITTHRAHSDTTTVLQPGEHRFIERPSVVFYADARLALPADLDRAVMLGCGRTHGAFEPAVLARMQTSMELSPMTPNKMKEAYRAADEQRGLLKPCRSACPPVCYNFYYTREPCSPEPRRC